ncbi:hypothetical protein ACH4VR_37915 [Streptomyces sp. NPDC020883]
MTAAPLRADHRGITDTTDIGGVSGTTGPRSARLDEERDFPWL